MSIISIALILNLIAFPLNVISICVCAYRDRKRVREFETKKSDEVLAARALKALLAPDANMREHGKRNVAAGDTLVMAVDAPVRVGIRADRACEIEVVSL